MIKDFGMMLMTLFMAVGITLLGAFIGFIYVYIRFNCEYLCPVERFFDVIMGPIVGGGVGFLLSIIGIVWSWTGLFKDFSRRKSKR